MSRGSSASDTTDTTAVPRSHDTDVVVIGSGVGGLSAAALAARHGNRVTVLESHYLAGGVAHAFEIEGYKFDAGPSLWAGMSQSGTNPLRQILDVLEEEVEWISYDGWGMHTPEGYFRFRTGPDDFVNTLRQLGGEDDIRAWVRARGGSLVNYLNAFGRTPPQNYRIFAVEGTSHAQEWEAHIDRYLKR